MFGEDESETPRRPSPWRSLSNVALPDAQPATSSASLLRPSTLAQFLDSQIKGFCQDQRSWRDLEPEVDTDGHIEYKLRILAPTPARFEKLTTQLKWRLLEGGGTALYEIGVLDDGTLVGITRQEVEESLSNLSRMASQLDAYIELVHVIELPEILINAGPIQPDCIADCPSKPQPFSQLSRFSSKSSTASERKEKARQKKKKKKARSRSVSSIVATKTPVRAAPGDSAVSSDSEPIIASPVLKATASAAASPLEAVDESQVRCPSSLTSSFERLRLDERPKKRWLKDNKRSSRQINRLGGYQDQISPVTPEERGIIRRAARQERRMKAREDTRRAKAKAKAAMNPNFRPGEAQDIGIDSHAKPGIKYVVEVKVFKTAQRHQEDCFLNFEGFGIG